MSHWGQSLLEQNVLKGTFVLQYYKNITKPEKTLTTTTDYNKLIKEELYVKEIGINNRNLQR